MNMPLPITTANQIKKFIKGMQHPNGKFFTLGAHGNEYRLVVLSPNGSVRPIYRDQTQGSSKKSYFQAHVNDTVLISLIIVGSPAPHYITAKLGANGFLWDSIPLCCPHSVIRPDLPPRVLDWLESWSVGENKLFPYFGESVILKERRALLMSVFDGGTPPPDIEELIQRGLRSPPINTPANWSLAEEHPTFVGTLYSLKEGKWGVGGGWSDRQINVQFCESDKIRWELLK